MIPELQQQLFGLRPQKHRWVIDGSARIFGGSVHRNLRREWLYLELDNLAVLFVNFVDHGHTGVTVPLATSSLLSAASFISSWWLTNSTSLVPAISAARRSIFM
jgi:hypothetical protein